jgi:hypothetical protein
MKRHDFIVLWLCLSLGALSSAGCHRGGPEPNLALSSGYTSRRVGDAEVIVIPVYEEGTHKLEPEKLSILGVTVRERHAAAQPAQWSLGAAAVGSRGPMIGLAVTIPPEMTSPLVIEAELEYNGRPQMLQARLSRRQVGRRRVWYVEHGVVRPVSRRSAQSANTATPGQQSRRPEKPVTVPRSGRATSASGPTRPSRPTGAPAPAGPRRN